MQFNKIFKTIFEYIRKKFRFVHTNTFCEYRKKLRASPRVHLVYEVFSKSHHLKNIIGGACPQTPLANAWKSAMQITPLFQKYFEPPLEMKS